MTGHEMLTELLCREGVSTAFGLMGDCNAHLMFDLAERQVRVVQARDEHAALAMADGYARVSPNVGVCLVTCGPGFTQALTSLAVAVWRKSPVVLIAGDAPRARRIPQAPNRRALAEAVGASFVDASDDDLGAATREAFRRARSGSPTVLNVSIDAQVSPATAPGPVPPSLIDTPVQPETTHVVAAADEISRAARPVILAGRGAMQANSRAAILELGEIAGALLATTLPTRDWFAGESFDLGVAGGLSRPTVAELLSAADLLVVVGASLDSMTTRQGTLFEGARLVRIDVVAKPDEAVAEVIGDARLAVEAISAELLRRGAAADRYRSKAVRQRLTTPDAHVSDSSVPDGLLDPTEVVRALSDLMPRDAIIVNSIGHYWWFPMTGFGGRSPDAYVTPYEFGVMGQAFPVGMGASCATARPVIVLEGDGGLMTNIQELETVAREDIDLLMVVMNDGAYGAEVEYLERHARSGDLARYGFVDFVATARTLGVNAHRTTTVAELQELYASKERGKALVIDVRIPAAHVPPRLQSIVHTR